MNQQEIFVKNGEMCLESIQDSLDGNGRTQRQQAFLIESIIGVNQNLPSQGCSTPTYSWSRQNSFTLDDDQVMNQKRKFSFEMIDGIFKDIQPIKNPGLPIKEAMNLEICMQEPKIIQRARSHSLASIDDCSSELGLNKPHHSMKDCDRANPIRSEPLAQELCQTHLITKLDPFSSRTEVDEIRFVSNSVVEQQQEFCKNSQKIDLHQLVESATDAFFSSQDYLDFDEQLSLANAYIPEGKNGKSHNNISAQKHLDFREKHGLQPDWVGSRC